jgi:hypothetical protein
MAMSNSPRRAQSHDLNRGRVAELSMPVDSAPSNRKPFSTILWLILAETEKPIARPFIMEAP